MRTLQRPGVVAVSLGALLAALSVAPGRAIENGVPDYDAHPNVGMLVFDFDGDGPAPWFALCSGSVISDNVFLTAAHCISSVASPFLRWGVTLEGGAPGSPVYPPSEVDRRDARPVPVLVPVTAATGAVVHPESNINGRLRVNDVALVIFPEGTFDDIDPVRLPTAGALDQQWPLHDLLTVGYGGAMLDGVGPLRLVFVGYRQMTTTPFQALTPDYIRIQTSPAATDGGGICGGDSGAPILDGDVAVAVISGGPYRCAAGNAYGTRLDTASARSFLSQFVTLP